MSQGKRSQTRNKQNAAQKEDPKQDTKEVQTGEEQPESTHQEGDETPAGDSQYAKREEVDALREQNQQIMGLLEELNTYIHTTHRTEPEDEQVDLGAAEFNNDNQIEQPDSVDPNSPQFKAHAEEMAFMNERVTIELHTTAERDAQQVVPVSVNGKTAYFMRGQQYTVPRYMVEVLARACPVHFENTEYLDEDGMKRVRYDASQGLRFPFHVVEDNQRGRQWFRNLTRMGPVRPVHV